MTCLTKTMLERGASYPEVQAVLDADRLLSSDSPASDHALDTAQQVLDEAAEKWLGFNIYEREVA